MSISGTNKGFGTTHVFLMVFITLMGAILFLRLGHSVGSIGFLGTISIIILGHLVTIPTALSLSEIATNQRVEGGGEYFSISRSFGLNIGATIGIALYILQTICIAFYVIAFAESFTPLFNYFDAKGVWFPHQLISIPCMIFLINLMLRRGGSFSARSIFLVAALVIATLVLFFLGNTGFSKTNEINLFSLKFGNIGDSFFPEFAIIFPAFIGVGAGMGFANNLKNPGKSIAHGTLNATLIGFALFCLVALKLTFSASPDDLVNIPLIMSKIGLLGVVLVPLALAASTYLAALWTFKLAPKTLQALAIDESLPLVKLNALMAQGKGKSKRPYNAIILTSVIAFFFVLQGEIDFVAKIVTVFFMVTYGSVCAISFLYQFGGDPTFRPTIRSRWYFSLTGFLASIIILFCISTTYAFIAILGVTMLYFFVIRQNPNGGNIASVFHGALFQLNRYIKVLLQKKKNTNLNDRWRPSVICVSKRSFESEKAFQLLEWISKTEGFGTYIHLIEDYFSKTSNTEAKEIKDKLIELGGEKSNVYIDTLISPSFTSAIAQVVQLPGISGMPNNMILFEFDNDKNEGLQRIRDNMFLARAANLDICVLASSARKILFSHGIHIWYDSNHFENSNRLILLSYFIFSHPSWMRGNIKLFEMVPRQKVGESRQKLIDLIKSGNLPIASSNIEIIGIEDNSNQKAIINERSKDAGLTLIGFSEEQSKNDAAFFSGYDELGNILFVNASGVKEIS